MDTAPFGVTLPPPRQLVDSSVASFQALSASTIVVLGTNENLWLEEGPFNQGTQGYSSREQIDGNVQQFEMLGPNQGYVLGTDGTLWLEDSWPWGTVPPTGRQKVDTAVFSFSAIDANDVLTLGTNGNLWLEHGPFGSAPPPRVLVDSNVDY